MVQVLPMVRRLVARRPWLQWVVIAAIGVGVAAAVADAMAEVDAARAAWGSSSEVWIASHDVAVGEPVVAEAIEVPASIRPAEAVDDVTDAVARQAIGRGEIVVRHDLMAPDDELALAPAGWLVSPVEERPGSGADAGDRVQVAADGMVLAPEGIVVATLDGVTLVAVPADVAPLVSAASTTSGVTLLRVP